MIDFGQLVFLGASTVLTVSLKYSLEYIINHKNKKKELWCNEVLKKNKEIKNCFNEFAAIKKEIKSEKLFSLTTLVIPAIIFGNFFIVSYFVEGFLIDTTFSPNEIEAIITIFAILLLIEYFILLLLNKDIFGKENIKTDPDKIKRSFFYSNENLKDETELINDYKLIKSRIQFTLISLLTLCIFPLIVIIISFQSMYEEIEMVMILFMFSLIFLLSIKDLLNAGKKYDSYIKGMICEKNNNNFPLIKITTKNQKKFQGKIENIFQENIVSLIAENKIYFILWDDIATIEWSSEIY